MNLVDELHAVCAALVGAGIRHAICGGIAVTIYGATRTTKDIDMLVSPDDLERALEVVLVNTSAGPLVVVARDVLIRMKRMSGRPQDAADITAVGHALCSRGRKAFNDLAEHQRS